MRCTGTGPVTELQFIASLPGRDRGQCRGPCLRMVIPGHQVQAMRGALVEYPLLYQRWWDGFDPQYRPGIVFTLCAGHWMDLSYAIGCVAGEMNRQDWFIAASTLLRRISLTAGWDLKEISNLLAWQRVQLT